MLIKDPLLPFSHLFLTATQCGNNIGPGLQMSNLNFMEISTEDCKACAGYTGRDISH